MVRPGLINLDFADVRAVMDEMGKAMMGTGEAEGEDRAIQAAEKAIANPLLDEISLNGAKGVLINITGGYDLTLFELDEAANRIREEVDSEANIIVGSTLDTTMESVMRVSVVATGIDAKEQIRETPMPKRSAAPAPVQRPVVEEPVEEVAAATPMAGYTRPRVEPASETVARSEDEPLLFDEIAEEDEPAPMFARSTSNEVPQPAYQPAASDERAAPGSPTPEALARLQAAVRKVPAAQPERAQPRAVEEDERPRFGINSLINRMTGHSGDEPLSQRQQPPVRAVEEDEVDPDQERIEIPAFLRRQAN